MSTENNQDYLNYDENYVRLIACDYFIIYLLARTGKNYRNLEEPIGQKLEDIRDDSSSS